MEKPRHRALKRLDKGLTEEGISFLKARGLSLKTAQVFGIVSARAYFPDLSREDEAIAFPFFVGAKVSGHKVRSITEKAHICDSPLSSLFGIQNVDLAECEDIVFTEGECLTDAAEVLTPDGWVSIRDVQTSDTIAQWDNGVISWVNPIAKVEKPYSGELIRFKDRFVVTTVTPGHRMPGILDGDIRVLTAEEREIGNRHHKLPRSGVMDASGIDLSDDQIAFCLAVSADAAIDCRRNGEKYARISFKKERKAERMRDLLSRLGLEYTETVQPSQPDMVFFGVRLPGWVPGRLLPWSWVAEASAAQRNYIIDELRWWDGNVVPNRNQTEYSTKHVHNAEVVQALCHSSGRVSTIIRRKNAHGEWFKVSILHGKSGGTYQHMKPTRVWHDGFVYCVTVPSSFFLVREGGKVIVTGNCDAMAFYEANILNAVSVPNGSSSFNNSNDDGTLKAQLGFLWDAKEKIDKAKRILIATDADDPGEKIAEELARRVGRHRCWRVTFPEGCKDANDTLLKLGAAALQECVSTATPWPVDGLYEASKYFEEFDKLYDEGFGERVKTGIPAVDTIFSVAPGMLTVVTGNPNAGKSNFVNQLVLNLARDYGYVTAMCSFETPPAVHLGQLAEMLVQKHFFDTINGGEKMTREEKEAVKPFLLRHIKFMSQDDGKKATVESVIERIKTAVFRWGAKIVVIDPYTYIYRPPGAESETAFIDDMLTRIRLAAILYGVHVFFIAHPSKPQVNADGSTPVPRGYSISGSAAWFSKPDHGLTVHRLPDTNEVEIHCWKTRFAWLGANGMVKVYFDPMRHVYFSDGFSEFLPYEP